MQFFVSLHEHIVSKIFLFGFLDLVLSASGRQCFLSLTSPDHDLLLDKRIGNAERFDKYSSEGFPEQMFIVLHNTTDAAVSRGLC